MTVNIEISIAWMKARKGQVSYSMDDRNGPDSYDCSSSIYYALTSAGATSAGWAVNTEYEHDWLKQNGYELISENTPWDAQRGDIFIWGRRGYSSGSGGHTGMFIDSDNIIHCNYPYDGISVNDYDERWLYAGRPYYYIYRLTNSGAQPDRIETGWQKNDTGYWYVKEDGSYPKDKFEKVNGTWYYFDGSGYMLADRWKKHSDGNWYVRAGQGWYYIKADGTMADKPEFTVEPDGLITTK